ncbi:hypothetical protein [Actinokineospora globicatena]|uniref:hypothetical protein n=1 Tax=Actinokineospora globicatena TaxID=103729 RepID=UPI0020A5DEEA|nr:hypothetical protein [Actinokineospora globicatena]MCP2304376.1 hypothetical protein [Actinokineospora globicatena]GLW78259.1 hypothetical protein Aglo01_27410 [Actinokineospora globicatena]GLW85075.1 hypothetical protein Aglo02_27150 [Actinokineospora globicatena]
MGRKTSRSAEAGEIGSGFTADSILQVGRRVLGVLDFLGPRDTDARPGYFVSAPNMVSYANSIPRDRMIKALQNIKPTEVVETD